MSVIRLGAQELPPDCVVFKHSTACGLSASAAREVEALQVELPVYQVNVREQRALSNWVADRYAVPHEVILVRGGRALRVWNHGEVRRADVEAAVRADSAAPPAAR
jgi:bacillithiol system protein YtxJ